jgi:uncharacterized membrane protein
VRLVRLLLLLITFTPIRDGIVSCIIKAACTCKSCGSIFRILEAIDNIISLNTILLFNRMKKKKGSIFSTLTALKRESVKVRCTLYKYVKTCE